MADTRICEWRTHYFRGLRCTCGAFTMNEDGSLTENAYDPLPVACAVCNGAPESTLHLGLATAKGHRYEPATSDPSRTLADDVRDGLHDRPHP